MSGKECKKDFHRSLSHMYDTWAHSSFQRTHALVVTHMCIWLAETKHKWFSDDLSLSRSQILFEQKYYNTQSTENILLHFRTLTEENSVFCGVVKKSKPPLEEMSTLRVSACACMLVYKCVCVCMYTKFYNAQPTTPKEKLLWSTASRAACWPAGVGATYRTFLHSMPHICWSKNHGAHAETTALMAPVEHIENIKSNKYYILLPQRMACLWSLRCTVYRPNKTIILSDH